MQEDQSPNFLSLESKVFTKTRSGVYLGREQIKQEYLDLLREQARYFKTSQLYEVLRASILNESYRHALVNSEDFEQVKFAKALYHWQFFLDNLLENLTNN